MSLELVNTVATLGTFIVIAVTAIAAMVQLRHMRSSNYIAALNEIRETIESDAFKEGRRFIQSELHTALQDPELRYQLTHPFARTREYQPAIDHLNMIGNFFESMGVMVKTGLADPEMIADMWSQNIVDIWKAMEPATAIYRRRVGEALWENFESLAVAAEDYIKKYPNGSYPRGRRRFVLSDDFAAADAVYETTRSDWPPKVLS